MTRRLVIFAALLALAACSSVRTSARDPLPFHAVLAPVIATSPSNDGAPIAGETLTRALHDALQARCFTRVTLLEPVADDDRRDEAWIARGRELEADVVLVCELRAAPAVETELNEKFWLNLPLFLVGGPACWFVDDRSYKIDVRASIEVFDACALDASGARALDSRALLVRQESRFAETALDLSDRCNGRIAPYFLSIIVPPGWLVRDGPRVRAALEERIGAELSHALATGLLEHEVDLVEAERTSSFFLDPATRARWDGAQVVVEGAALLHVGDTERLDAWSVRAGDASLELSFGDGEPDAERSTARRPCRRHPLAARIAPNGRPRWLRLEIRGGGRNGERRTFTLPIA